MRDRHNRTKNSYACSLLVIILTLPLISFIACPKNERPDNSRVGVSMGTPTPQPAPIPEAIAFNGERALEHVRKQLSFGPRPPGSPELAQTRDYIVSELEKSGLQTTKIEFDAATPMGQKKMVNIVAEIPGETKDIIIISSHYDTKYFKDMLFVGANDPGASVGTLIELGRVLGANKGKNKLTYRLVFFDGEEAFCREWDECGKPDSPDNTYGSRHYVQFLKSMNQISQVRAMILLDMMGYKNLKLGRDTMSTRWLQDVIWQAGRDTGHGDVFIDEPEGVGGDDHEPFLRAGIDSVDIIQLNSYQYWHTPEDTLDKVSAKSMKIVGDVILASLPVIERRFTSRS
jgi:glutaminyl-peptide cyclotransferase